MARKSGKRYKRFVPWIHVSLWLAFLLIPLFFIENEASQIRYITLGWFLELLLAAYFYYNYLFLIPKFLLKKRILLFLILLFAGMFVISLLNTGFVYFTYDIFPHRWKFNFWWSFKSTIYPSLFIIALSSAIRITGEWFKNERIKEEMEAEKLYSDLAFLKSQINPHFLFNTLNNICSLARKKSDDTENAIIKLSQIMRYMLQDSKDEKVCLEKEVEYLESYIELQQMRLSEQIKTSFTVEGDPTLYMIQPLLLIPFVENAFKHGVSYYEVSNIEITLVLRENRLEFSVFNHKVKHKDEAIEPGSGIGLENVTRRLELLYPHAHELKIKDDGEHYRVDLSIQF